MLHKQVYVKGIYANKCKQSTSNFEAFLQLVVRCKLRLNVAFLSLVYNCLLFITGTLIESRILMPHFFIDKAVLIPFVYIVAQLLTDTLKPNEMETTDSNRNYSRT